MATLNSNSVSATIDKKALSQISPSTTITILRGKTEFSAVSGTPRTSQFRVSIASTKNCTAKIESDNKTITVLSITSTSGEIVVNINVENKKTYTKTIPVASITDMENIKTISSEYQQLADKFTWVVKNGTSSSNMELTDRVFNLVSNNITLTADHINLNGYVSNEDANWSIDNEGDMEARNLTVEGELSTDILSFNAISNAKYPPSLVEDVYVYVDAKNGNDDSEFENNARFATMSGLLDKMPHNLNGHTVDIQLLTDINENILFKSFSTGTIRLYLSGHYVYGYIRSYWGTSAKIYMYGGYIGQVVSDMTYGMVHPSTGCAVASRTATIGVGDNSSITMYKVDVYGSDNANGSATTKVGIASDSFASVYFQDVHFYNCDIACRANAGGRIHADRSYGVASQYGFQASTGGIISLNDNTQVGGVTANTNKSSGGQLWYNNPKFTTGAQTTTTNTATTSTTKVVTYKSNYGDTYRSTVYNNWKKDGSCRQGDWGYGDCTGLWFFGNQFASLKGKTITKVTITIKRQNTNNGLNSAVEHKLWMHNYSSRPSGAPTLTSGWSKTFTLTRGQTTTITITDSAVLNAIKNGTCKGFGIRHTYDRSHYSACSGSVTVKITYQE